MGEKAIHLSLFFKHVECLAHGFNRASGPYEVGNGHAHLLNKYVLNIWCAFHVNLVKEKHNHLNQGVWLKY